MAKTKISAWVGRWVCKGGCSHAVIFFPDGSVSEVFSTKFRGLTILNSTRQVGAVSRADFRALRQQINDTGLVYWNEGLDDEDEHHSQLSMDGAVSMARGGIMEGEIQ